MVPSLYEETALLVSRCSCATPTPRNFGSSFRLLFRSSRCSVRSPVSHNASSLFASCDVLGLLRGPFAALVEPIFPLSLLFPSLSSFPIQLSMSRRSISLLYEWAQRVPYRAQIQETYTSGGVDHSKYWKCHLDVTNFGNKITTAGEGLTKKEAKNL